MVANFKTEESQRRLLTALIAAHPELKLNFKGRYRYTSIRTCISSEFCHWPHDCFESCSLPRSFSRLFPTSEAYADSVSHLRTLWP